MPEIPEQVTRDWVARDMRAMFEASLEERVNRHIEIAHQGVTPNHHFAAASSECIALYTDGHFISTVMVTQAVAEAIRRFAAERNGLDPCQGGEMTVSLLLEKRLISQECADAFNRIYKSFRNDVHHMNPQVAKIGFRSLAKNNIQDLAKIEGELFAYLPTNGAWRPVNPQYWDVRNGLTSIYLRLAPP